MQIRAVTLCSYCSFKTCSVQTYFLSSVSAPFCGLKYSLSKNRIASQILVPVRQSEANKIDCCDSLSVYESLALLTRTCAKQNSVLRKLESLLHLTKFHRDHNADLKANHSHTSKAQTIFSVALQKARTPYFFSHSFLGFHAFNPPT